MIDKIRRRSYLSSGESVQGVLNVAFYGQQENMADSDSGTHVTDISESFPDDFVPRKEGKRRGDGYHFISFSGIMFQTMVH